MIGKWIRRGCLLILFASAMILATSCQKKEETFEEIAIHDPTIQPQQTEAPTPTPLPATEQPIPATPEPTPVPTPKPPNMKPGKVGYIVIDNTNVNYPIMLAEDNKYYLNRDINGKRNANGSIFLDYRNANADKRRNMILYGHNMKDKSMFTTLHKFEVEQFFLDNKIINFELTEKPAEYEIVLAGMLDYRKFNHIRTVFKSEEDFVSYYSEAKENIPFVRAGYTPQPGDEMLTLSTCVSHSIKDYDYKRMVVIARKIKDPSDTSTIISPGNQADEIEAAEVPGE